jgi:hypothetical protein
MISPWDGLWRIFLTCDTSNCICMFSCRTKSSSLAMSSFLAMLTSTGRRESKIKNPLGTANALRSPTKTPVCDVSVTEFPSRETITSFRFCDSSQARRAESSAGSDLKFQVQTDERPAPASSAQRKAIAAVHSRSANRSNLGLFLVITKSQVNSLSVSSRIRFRAQCSQK